jgi:hypothetical protein
MDVKLGLWETTMRNLTDMSSMMPPEVLARLTPEQRAKMEGAMGRGGSGATTTKHCVTKDTINEALASANTNNARMNCTRTFVTSTSTKQVIHMECTSGPMKTSGDIQVEVIDRENTKGSMVMTSGGGRGGNMKMEWTTKWLGADCGDVGQK